MSSLLLLVFMAITTLLLFAGSMPDSTIVATASLTTRRSPRRLPFTPAKIRRRRDSPTPDSVPFVPRRRTTRFSRLRSMTPSVAFAGVSSTSVRPRVRGPPANAPRPLRDLPSPRQPSPGSTRTRLRRSTPRPRRN